jgi:hypothetical protein
VLPATLGLRVLFPVSRHERGGESKVSEVTLE